MLLYFAVLTEEIVIVPSCIVFMALPCRTLSFVMYSQDLYFSWLVNIAGGSTSRVCSSLIVIVRCCCSMTSPAQEGLHCSLFAEVWDLVRNTCTCATIGVRRQALWRPDHPVPPTSPISTTRTTHVRYPYPDVSTAGDGVVFRPMLASRHPVASVHVPIVATMWSSV